MNLSQSTLQWVVTTITSYVLVGLFVLSNLADPVIKLDPALSVALLIAGLAGLGITGIAGYRAVSVNQQLATHNKFEKKVVK